MKIAAALLAASVLSAPVQAQDRSSFTNADETLLRQCIETINDIASTAPESSTSMSACIGVASNACQAEPDGASTSGIVACNQRETAWWDQYLNDNYEQAQNVLDPSVFASLKAAQRSWIAFRDAQCNFEYMRYGDGSMRSIAQTSCMMDQTARRAIDLYAISLDEIDG